MPSYIVLTVDDPVRIMPSLDVLGGIGLKHSGDMEVNVYPSLRGNQYLTHANVKADLTI